MQELNDRLSSAHGMILVAIDGTNSDFGWNNSDNLMKRPQYFFVVAKAAPSNDTNNVFIAQKESEAVASQIVARMMQDGSSYHPDSALQFLDPASMTFRGIGPIGDNFYGVIFGFNFNRPVNYMINKNMWEG
ncbi:hypothetical protein LJC11_03025 [Bacteroidales bacterium OttesenSCG-928-I21]|nr:hypothetical protein [Bacteroidales bacterium OttesenSCG-928-I21]